jgi:hypothetical protein
MSIFQIIICVDVSVSVYVIFPCFIAHGCFWSLVIVMPFCLFYFHGLFLGELGLRIMG